GHRQKEGESRALDHNLRPKPYMKAGHFSTKIPGQLSAEINIQMCLPEKPAGHRRIHAHSTGETGR
ncbi:hypothetical protein, partial [Nitratireductor sp. StC3]|uniref:hypothetical protein n=1 Tax=Nitratireductor sp. StC3 TaxID=2126741 RepID=UPI001AEC84D9